VLPASVRTTSAVRTAVKVDGQSIGGQTVRAADTRTGHVRFEACLTDRLGNPAPRGRVRLEYQVPGRMGMMHRVGQFMLYDDGTHGDITPGDAEYCYEDIMGEFSCHGTDSPMGPYHYGFCGIDEHGEQGNHVTVTVTLAP